MMEIKKAYSIALEEANKRFRNAELLGCTDIEDRYAFSFGNNGKPIIGAPVFTVNKNSGEIGYLSIPPIENLKLLNNGNKIDLTTIL